MRARFRSLATAVTKLVNCEHGFFADDQVGRQYRCRGRVTIRNVPPCAAGVSRPPMGHIACGGAEGNMLARMLES